MEDLSTKIERVKALTQELSQELSAIESMLIDQYVLVNIGEEDRFVKVNRVYGDCFGFVTHTPYMRGDNPPKISDIIRLSTKDEFDNDMINCWHNYHPDYSNKKDNG